jgi:hypothetical protein
METTASQVRTRLECDSAETTFAQAHDVTIDLFRQALHDIHTVAQRSRPLPPVQVDAIRQYWQPLPALSCDTRLSAFRARVRETIKGLLEIRAAMENDPQVGGRTGTSNDQEEAWAASDSGFSLRLSPSEYAEIHRLHTFYLGWSTLVYLTKRDEAAGFACGDSSWMQAEAQSVRVSVDEWFRRARQRHDLPVEDGWKCEVNFNTGCLVAFCAGPEQKAHGAHELVKQNPETEERPEVVQLADMDFQYIQSILELRGALVDAFRSRYSSVEAVRADCDQARALLQEIGDVMLGVDAWYEEMVPAVPWVPTEEWSIDMYQRSLFPDSGGLHPLKRV